MAGISKTVRVAQIVPEVGNTAKELSSTKIRSGREELLKKNEHCKQSKIDLSIHLKLCEE